VTGEEEGGMKGLGIGVTLHLTFTHKHHELINIDKKLPNPNLTNNTVLLAFRYLLPF